MITYFKKENIFILKNNLSLKTLQLKEIPECQLCKQHETRILLFESSSLSRKERTNFLYISKGTRTTPSNMGKIYY